MRILTKVGDVVFEVPFDDLRQFVAGYVQHNLTGLMEDEMPTVPPKLAELAWLFLFCDDFVEG